MILHILSLLEAFLFCLLFSNHTILRLNSVYFSLSQTICLVNVYHILSTYGEHVLFSVISVQFHKILGSFSNLLSFT